MLGLIIKDGVRWHDRWSAEIGRQLSIQDSTNDMYIFDDRHSRDEILSIIKEAPEELYQLVELKDAPEDACDFMLDSGRCYNRVH